MVLNILTAVIACGALTLSIIVFFRARKDTQLKIFTDYVNVATDLFVRKKEFETAGKVFEWSIIMLNHLDYLAYLVNTGKLSMEYAELFKPHIDSWYESVVAGQLKNYLKDTPEKFEELKVLYNKLNHNKT